MISFIRNLFRHNCNNHSELISMEYTKCGMSGVYFGLIKEFKCDKCGKVWKE